MDKSLGSYLREEREKRGISLEQVGSATKINIKLLNAIENDLHRELPARPFLRGFVISYCRFVGMDSGEVMTQYRAFFEEYAANKRSQNSHSGGYAFERKENERSRMALWIVMGSFVLVGGILILLLKPALKHRRVGHIENLREEVLKDPAPKPSAAATAEPVAAATPAVPAQAVAVPSGAKPVAEAPKDQPKAPEKLPGKSVEPNRIAADADPMNKGDSLPGEQIRYKVVLKSLKDAWIRYQVDDRPIMTFVLRKDRMLVLRSSIGIKVQSAHADSFLIRPQNSEYKPLNSLKALVASDGNQWLEFPEHKADGGNSEPFFKGYSALPEAEPEPSAEN